MTVLEKLQKLLPGLALASALVFTTGCPGGDEMGGEGEMSGESMEMEKMEGMEGMEKGEGMDSESMPQ